MRALARNPDRLQRRKWYPQVEVVKGDLTEPHSLEHAMRGIKAAYYLVHSMSSGKHYPEVDLASARNFAEAAGKAGVEQIIYLGGLANPHEKIGRHMRSRIETGDILRQGNVPVTEFRASLVIGSGSISFEMIRYLTDQLPVLVGPVWFKRRTQPIATSNILDYLLSALENPAARGKIIEIGSQEIMTYADAMLRYATVRHLKRKLFMVPIAPLPLMAYIVDKMTPVPASIAYPLIDGMRSDSVISDYPATEVFPEIHPIPYEEAVQIALQELSPSRVERIWDIPVPDPDFSYTFQKHEGFLVEYWQVACRQPSELVFKAVQDASLSFRDRYSLDVIEPGRSLRLFHDLPRLGKLWIEWQVESLPGQAAHLAQTVFYAPLAVTGYLYWYVLYPFYRYKFTRLIHHILRLAHSQQPAG